MESKAWNSLIIKTAVLVVFGLITATHSKALTISAEVVVSGGCNKLRISWVGINNCTGNPPSPTFNDIYIFDNNIQVYKGSWNHPAGQSGFFDLDYSNRSIGSTIRINATIHYKGTWGCHNRVNSNILYWTVPPDQPITNLTATENLFGNRIDLSWNRISNVCYSSLAYNVYCNGMIIARDLPHTQLSFSHTGLRPGETNTYVVRAIANHLELPATSSLTTQGSTFWPNLTATHDDPRRVILRWNDFSKVHSASGFTIERWDGISSVVIADINSVHHTTFQDVISTHGPIPGFMYRYTIFVKPLATTGVTGVWWGKVAPNGRIIGSVRTPGTVQNPNGVGVPNVKIVAKLQGQPLPTDTTTTYIAYTNANGDYEIPNIYYYTSATFRVTPVFEGRTYSPIHTDVTLNSENPSRVNFTDLSSFIVSGNISQGGCPAQGVALLLNNDSTGVITDQYGNYSLTVSTGGTYTIKPLFGNNLFNPHYQSVTVTSDLTDVNFEDTTKYVIEGHVSASCNTYIGIAEILFYSRDAYGSCFEQTVITDVNGYYSVVLPARRMRITMTNFTSVNEQLINSAAVLSYFPEITEVDLTRYNPNTFYNDTTRLNFTYRLPPTIEMLGLSTYQTCSGEILPILQQHRTDTIEFAVWDSFKGSKCPAGDGYIIIRENISSLKMDINTDTIFYTQGQTIKYSFTPGTPNIIPPHKKFIEAIVVRDNQSDTVYADVIVVGHRPREQTFTTTTPKLPFHILHNPPGDGSYSYLEKGTSLSNSFTTSFLKEESLDAYIRAQLGGVYSVEVGLGAGISTEFRTQYDITGTLGEGKSELHEASTSITTTTNEYFRTSGNVNITGGDGDVYIGGALNMLYAATDVLRYNWNLCRLETDVTLVMQPTGIATTFMYTEEHILNAVIPELQNIVTYYTHRNNPLRAAYFLDQVNLWQQIVDANHRNIANADTIDNVSFSAGVKYNNSVETSRSESQSLDFNYYLDKGIALDLGLSVGGIGAFGGVAVRGRLTWGNVEASEEIRSTTVGYVLADDDLGDSFTVDILENKVYGVPAFRLVGGKSSCPFEPGTLPREDVQLIANTYSRSVEESQAAVFILQLGNTGQNNETRTYDLIFDHTSNPHGAVITIGGSPIVGNVPYPYTIGPLGSATVTITVRKGPIAQEYNGLKFTLRSQCDENISDDISLNVNFFKQFNLNVAVSGSGITNLPLGIHTRAEGERVDLFASPSKGFVFDRWVVGTTEHRRQAIQVLMDNNKTATAFFIPTALPQFTVNVSKVGNGRTLPASGNYIVNKDGSISLTALPETGHAFVKWVVNGRDYTDNEIDVIINENTTAIAYFAVTYTLTSSVAQGMGSTFPAQGINIINEGTTANLYASAALGYVFEKWNINGIEHFTPNVVITVSSNVIALAYFRKTTAQQNTVSISVSNNDGFTSPPAGQHFFANGSQITLAATPNKGKLFQKWIINSIETVTNPVTVTITGNIIAEAVFVDDRTSVQPIRNPENIVSVYPNPSRGIVSIESTQTLDNIMILDITGKVVFEINNVNANFKTINLDNFRSGLYIMKLYSGYDLTTIKLHVIK